MGPRVVDEMDMREINDLMAYWKDNPPPHVASMRVYYALGGKPAKETVRVTTAEGFAAAMGMKLPAKGAPRGK